jgi:P-type conjugative transfer protein TrbG
MISACPLRASSMVSIKATDSNQRRLVRLGRLPLLLALLSATAISGCTTTLRPPDIAYDDPTPAVLQRDAPLPVRVVEVPKVLPLPGQLKPLPDAKPTPEPADPTKRVSEANAAARMQPERDGFINAIQVYPFSEGALYQVYASPGEITDIALQPGEQLVGSGPVAAGDTVRWIIGDTDSGASTSQQTHILVKPTRPDINTNLVINTDRRTYHLELRATDSTYMASVSWDYPEDQLIALRQQNATAEAQQPVSSGLSLAAMNFRYAIQGDNVPWKPERAFDDGRQVFIQFPPGIGQGEMPPLFVIGPEGNTSQLVNYRVKGYYMIVDRLFAAAELRLGGGNTQKRVQIVRTDGSRRD